MVGFGGYLLYNTVNKAGANNSGTKRCHKGAPPLVGESELKHESELKPYRIGYDCDLIL